ncbi:MAG TPA: glycoside hydrolase domain-containing protein, partial [Solirubrobacteraceae bacterium]|nr:glycoside hydrolase domain-containing protein [Solirubrobacteraceae bacterium]
MRFGLDYSTGGMAPSAVRGVGADFVCRYVSTPGNPKNIGSGEAVEMSRAGIDIVLVFETTAERALAGRGAGAADARSAERQATGVGMPAGRPIYFAVDFDATPQQQAPIDEYFRGVASALGLDRTGAYGGYWVVKRLFDAGLIRWGWQTYAWSGGNWDPRAQLRQFSNSHTVGGIECDYDHGLGRDFGQWRVQHSPPPPPNPHLPLIVDGVLGGATVAAMQWALSIPDDGIFGAQTKRALQRR